MKGGREQERGAAELHALDEVATAACAYCKARRVDLGVLMALSRLFAAVALLDSVREGQPVDTSRGEGA